MDKKLIVKRFFIVALIALIIIQFIHPDQSVPEVDPSQDFIAMLKPPANVKAILKVACYDCHSYETKFPWYNKIQPVSFWLDGHIKHGRQKLNFSKWGTFSEKKKNHKLDEFVEYIEDKRMPLLSYTFAHWDAKLSPDDRQLLVEWARSKKSQ